MTVSGLTAFGYWEDPTGAREPYSMQVSRGMNPDTLEPRLVLRFRDTPDSDQVGYSLTVEQAEALAGQLEHWAARARKNSLRPDG